MYSNTVSLFFKSLVEIGTVLFSNLKYDGVAIHIRCLKEYMDEDFEIMSEENINTVNNILKTD